jgi:glycerol-3-phosphate acyltransferase PlsY
MTLAQMIEFAAAALGGYLLGSAPFGLLLGFAFGVGDLRKIGSGNIGATNMWRAGRKDLAVLTFVLDSTKAAVALAAARAVFGEAEGFAAGCAAFAGHCFPVWLKFKGGKGVSSFFGLLLAGMPYVGAAAALTWLATVFTFRISALGALAAAALAPAYALLLHRPAWQVWICVGLALAIFPLHHANLRRLLKGEEPKLGAGRARP